MTDKEWSWKDLISVLPVIGGGFALAYVVGYFYAFNIAWFAFFSLPEHLVFAIRALPIAIGASVGFLIALKRHWPDGRCWVTYIWIAVLLVCAVALFLSNHIGIAASLILVAVGARFYDTLPSPRSQNHKILFWAPTLLVLCLGVGFVSGYSRKHPVGFFRQSDCVTLTVNQSPPLSGHIIFAGNSWLLFYDYTFHRTLLLKRDNLIQVEEPREAACQRKPAVPPAADSTTPDLAGA